MIEGYILIWWYSDNSGHGHFNTLLSEREMDLLTVVLGVISDPSRNYEFIKVTKSIDMGDKKAP